jgi:hypothetical protein
MTKLLREILPITDSMATAIHEAGHVAISAALGVSVDRVDLLRIGNRQGMATIRWSEADWEADFQITLAGTMAEEMFGDDVREHGQSDMARLGRLLREADEDPEDWSPRIIDLADETMDLVAEHWAEIEQLAHLLMRRGRLCENEITAVMSK